MTRIKHLLIATTLLCSSVHATNQDLWDEIARHPLSEEPLALHSLITWMKPITVVLPSSSLCIRTQLVIELFSHYNNYLKPNVDRRLLNLFADRCHDCSMDMHTYVTDSLDRFVRKFMNELPNDRKYDLVPSELCITSHGYYGFMNQK